MITRGVSVYAAVSCLVVLCWTPTPAWAGNAFAQQVWSTRPDIVVGGEPGSATALTWLGDVKADASGARIVIRQMGRVTVWDTSSLQEPILEFGRRSDTPPFGSPLRAHPDSAGFWVRYDGGWGRFTRDGRLVRSAPNPPDRWQRTAILSDGSFLARERSPSPSREFTWEEGHPGWDIAVAHVRLGEGSWVADTLAMYDSRGQRFAVAVGRSQVFSGQPFADHDMFYLNSRHGAVGFVQRRGRTGQVRVVEIAAGNDTVLDARIPVSPVLLESERAEEAIQDEMRGVERMLRQSRGDTLSTSEVRAIVEEALYIPTHLPLVTAVVPTVSNEVWLRSSEQTDSGTVWYVLDWAESGAAPRQVLLPDWFRLRDATRDHVWGLHVDARLSGQVQGRRLVRD